MKYKTTIEALYVNISLNDADTVNEDDDIHMLEVTLLNSDGDDLATAKPLKTLAARVFPDASDDDGEDILDDTAPGASGWITAENMDEYMDENGNFSGMVIGEELGPGAGTVRAREDTEEGANVFGPDGVNGTDGHEGKYYRTG